MPRACAWGALLTACLLVQGAQAASTGEIEIRVVDAKTGDLIPVRMHLKDQRGKPVKPPKTLYWHDHFLVPGKIVLELRPGQYTFEMERGPEYRLRTGNFVLQRNDADNKTVEMVRFVDMKSEGWWSGDLHIHRDPEDVPLLMQAEDLHVAPVITWSNKTNRWQDKPLPDPALVKVEGNRFCQLLAGEDEREGGGLLFFNLPQPLDLAGTTREFPSGALFLAEAKKSGAAAHVDADRPFWWDLPMWVATGQLDSIGICHSHLLRDGLVEGEAWGKPHDAERYVDRDAVGRWSLEIYYHLLNCGLRLPPSAGSGSGESTNPLGYNRVYVHCGDDFTYEKWFEGLKAGRVVVTNGPMIRPLVNGQLPGHVFQAEKGETVELTVALNLSLREKVDYLEIVKDGKVLHEVRLDEFKNKQGQLPPVTFDESGWMLIRAVSNHPKTFRFAMTAPYYVEIGYQRRISKASAQFFLDWVYERARRIDLADPMQKQAVLAYHRAARDYWQKLVDEANAP